VPFLIAFGVLGVVMAVLIVGNVIAGAVSTGTRRIGILKALGFTPAQVVRAYLGQALIPAAVGAALGVVAGNLLAVPVLAETNRRLRHVRLRRRAVGRRAGGRRRARGGGADRLGAALAGRPAAHRRRARRRAYAPARPRPVGGPADRPAPAAPADDPRAGPSLRPPLRSAGIVAAIAFGAAAVTFAVGSARSLGRRPGGRRPRRRPVGAPTAGSPASRRPATSDRGRRARPGGDRRGDHRPARDRRVLRQARTEVTVAGITGALTTVAFTGDDGAGYYQMVSGTWLTGPGEIVVSTPFLTATGKRVGDTVVLTDHGTAVTVRIVGEAFNIDDKGMQILTDARDARAPPNPTCCRRPTSSPAARDRCRGVRVGAAHGAAVARRVGAARRAGDR
jgi:putative ABC transport system permease protein